MKGFQPAYDDHFSDDRIEGSCEEDHRHVLDPSPTRQTIDSDFLDAVCNGVITVGDDLKIASQNYVSRLTMGDLRGQTCFRALENRDTPCEHCPKARELADGYETSMRCAGKAYALYETRLYPNASGGVVEVYPDMIDREVLLKNMHLYGEEMRLLSDVVENISSALQDDKY